MIDHDLQVIRDGVSAWNRGEPEAMVQGLSHDVQVVTSGLFPGIEREYHGHPGALRFFTDFRSAWQDIAIDVHRIAEGRTRRYAVLGRFHATGRDDVQVERPVGIVFTLADEGVVRMENFGSWEQAIDAAGVPPERREG